MKPLSRILVTGATGFIGANVVRALRRRMARPRLLVRERSDRRGLRGLLCEEALGDVLDMRSLTDALKGIECVVHLAGAGRPNGPRALERLDIEGSRNVGSAAKEAGARRIVFVSCAAALGAGTLERPGTEEPSPFGTALSPAERKLRAEQALREAARGLEVVVVHPAFAVGPYDVRPTSGALLLGVARGWLRFYPPGGTSFVNAADAAEGIVLALERGRAGERYILGGENLTWREFLTLCAEECGAPRPQWPLPSALSRPTRWLSQRLLADWPRWARAPQLHEMFGPAYYSHQKASRELGYRPGPVRVGVREAYRWFQEEGFLPRDRPLTPH